MAKSGSGTEDLDNPFFRFALPSDKLGKKKPTFGDLGVQQDDEGYAVSFGGSVSTIDTSLIYTW